jgi:hypothetical protein
MTFVRLKGPRGIPAPLSPLDPRTAAWRRDLADLALADAVVANAYARPVRRLVTARSVPLLAEPDRLATATSELLHGEGFAVLDEQAGFAWGFGAGDHYVGWVEAEALGPETPEPALLVGPGDALLFREPRVKAPVAATLPAGAEVRVEAVDERFVTLTHGPFAGTFLHRRHILEESATDWVATAERFLGTPYRWGGRTRAGVDCSGLVALAWKLAGRAHPRDSDMLFAAAGADVSIDALARGDIVWWPGHIGVMAGERLLLHANAHWMATVVEPLAQVVERLGAEPAARRPAS